jgi:predicted HicB family RNase H-like nuclease
MIKSKMVHIRLDKETHKKLLYLCIEKETSIQKYVERLIENDIEDKKM